MANTVTGVTIRRTATGDRSVDSRSSSMTYAVEFDSITDLALAMSLAETARYGTTAVPLLSETHPRDQFRIATRISTDASEMNAGIILVVVQYDVRFEANPGGDPGAQGGTDPLEQPAAVSYSTVSTVEDVDYDAAGDPITNSVGQVVTLSRQFSDMAITISRNVPKGFIDDNRDKFFDFCDSVNLDGFFGGDESWWMMTRISAQRNVDPIHGEYWTVTMEAQRREPVYDDDNVLHSGWERRYINEGTLEVDWATPGVATGKLMHKPIIVDGTAITEPVPLAKKSVGQILRLDPGVKPVMLFARMIPAKPWGSWAQNMMG